MSTELYQGQLKCRTVDGNGDQFTSYEPARWLLLAPDFYATVTIDQGPPDLIAAKFAHALTSLQRLYDEHKANS